MSQTAVYVPESRDIVLAHHYESADLEHQLVRYRHGPLRGFQIFFGAGVFGEKSMQIPRYGLEPPQIILLGLRAVRIEARAVKRVTRSDGACLQIISDFFVHNPFPHEIQYFQKVDILGPHNCGEQRRSEITLRPDRMPESPVLLHLIRSYGRQLSKISHRDDPEPSPGLVHVARAASHRFRRFERHPRKHRYFIYDDAARAVHTVYHSVVLQRLGYGAVHSAFEYPETEEAVKSPSGDYDRRGAGGCHNRETVGRFAGEVAV